MMTQLFSLVVPDVTSVIFYNLIPDLSYKKKLKISLLLLIFCYVKLICCNCKKKQMTEVIRFS